MTSPVVPPHRDAGPIAPQKIRAVCTALAAVVDLQDALTAQRRVETQESAHG